MKLYGPLGGDGPPRQRNTFYIQPDIMVTLTSYKEKGIAVAMIYSEDKVTLHGVTIGSPLHYSFPLQFIIDN